MDVERLAKAAYLDRPPLGRRPVPWTPALRRDWTAWARRMAVALADAPPDPSWQTDAEGYVTEPLVNEGAK